MDYFFDLGLSVKYKIMAPMNAYVALAVCKKEISMLYTV